MENGWPFIDRNEDSVGRLDLQCLKRICLLNQDRLARLVIRITLHRHPMIMEV